MRKYSKFSSTLRSVRITMNNPDYVVLRTGDGHWMALVGSVLILPTGRIFRPRKEVVKQLWSITESVRWRHPKYDWDFMDIISPYVGGRWVNFAWYYLIQMKPGLLGLALYMQMVQLLSAYFYY